MVLAVDIGNTDIAIGGFENDALRFVVRISTDTTKTVQEYENIIYQMLTQKGVDKDTVEGAIVSSVVPSLSSVLSEVMSNLYSVTS